ALDVRRSTGKVCFNWYRIKLTVPELIAGFDPTGSTVAFSRDRRLRGGVPASGRKVRRRSLGSGAARLGLVLRDGELNGHGGTRMRRLVGLDECPRDHERRLAPEPREPAVALTAEAGFAIDDPGACEVEPSEVVACRVEQVGNVDLHRAQILHAVHVTVGVGLAVVPDPRRRLDEVWTAVDRHQAGEVGELGHPRGRVAEAERGRQGGDAAPRGVRVVAGEDVHEPGLRDDGAVAGADHVAALAEEAANAAGGVERLREERLA